MKDKRELVRVVMNQSGGVSLDPTGKLPGRGAYVCRNVSCMEKAIKNRGFDRSFKRSVPKEIYEALREKIAALPHETES